MWDLGRTQRLNFLNLQFKVSDMNAVNNNQPITPEFWKKFLNDIPEFVWTSTFLSKKHINAAKNQFPMVGLNRTKPLLDSSVKHYKTKIYALSDEELTELSVAVGAIHSEAEGAALKNGQSRSTASAAGVAAVPLRGGVVAGAVDHVVDARAAAVLLAGPRAGAAESPLGQRQVV